MAKRLITRESGACVMAALLLSACASTSGPSTVARPAGNDCMFASTLRDWRPLDNENLILFANGRRPYHVELFMPAFSLTYEVMIGVYDRDGRICPYGGDAIVIDGVLPERIPIRSIRRLTDTELDALYVEFGVEPPEVFEATAVEPEAVED
jgi:hypothetical protein